MQPNLSIDKIKFCHDTRHKCDLKEGVILPDRIRIIIDERVQRRSFTMYKKKVWRLTESVANKIPGIEKRAFKNYHIDHITSIWDGFRNGIPEETIAGLSNLRMLYYRDNMAKGIKSGVTWK